MWLVCVSNMITTKANAKENQGEFICLSITKANANSNLHIFITLPQRSPAKGVWQKSDEKSDKSVRKSDRKVTERVPKTKKSDRTPFADLLLRHPDFICNQFLCVTYICHIFRLTGSTLASSSKLIFSSLLGGRKRGV